MSDSNTFSVTSRARYYADNKEYYRKKYQGNKKVKEESLKEQFERL